MQYDLAIKDQNCQAHLDIESDLQVKQNGLFTFILRINSGNITDYNLMEHIDAKTKYLRLKEVTFTEFGVTLNHRQ